MLGLEPVGGLPKINAFNNAEARITAMILKNR